MSFTQNGRIWWDTTKPGRSTVALSDADIATTPSTDDDSGISDRPVFDRWVVCARSGFPVPFRETVIDPYTGQRVWARYVDRIHLLDKGGNRPPRTPTNQDDL